LQEKLFGRKNEIDQLWHAINNKDSSVTYIIGEGGIGKSALLCAFYDKLNNEKTKFLVGFYGNEKVLVGESFSPLYPFITALLDLLEWLKTTTQTEEIMKSIVKQLEHAFVKFSEEKGSEMVGAILHDIAKKFGLDETLKVARDLIKDIRGEQSVTAVAWSYARENSVEPVISYGRVFESLLEEFGDRSFILIVDRFETVRKSSVDFLVNLTNYLQQRHARFHIIVSFTIEEEKWGVMVANEFLLHNLAYNTYTIVAVAQQIATHFDKLPYDIKIIIFDLADDERAIAGAAVIRAVTSNYDKLPSNATDLLFKLADKKNCAQDLKHVLETNLLAGCQKM
jgi:AAA+ ATPase superfamily predicted ATPase